MAPPAPTTKAHKRCCPLNVEPTGSCFRTASATLVYCVQTTGATSQSLQSLLAGRQSERAVRPPSSQRVAPSCRRQARPCGGRSCRSRHQHKTLFESMLCTQLVAVGVRCADAQQEQVPRLPLESPPQQQSMTTPLRSPRLLRTPAGQSLQRRQRTTILTFWCCGRVNNKRQLKSENQRIKKRCSEA